MQDDGVFDEWLHWPVPAMPLDELQLFRDKASIDAHKIDGLDPAALLGSLHAQVGTKVMGIDVGGGSARGSVFVVSSHGLLEPTDDFSRTTESEEGVGYLEQLEAFAGYAKERNLAVGMSYGGPTDGTVPRRHPKIPKLVDGLQEKYGGDFAPIFDTPFRLLNDGPAGLLRSIKEIVQEGTPNPAVLYLINGGGLGLGVYAGGAVYTTEAGHVRCVDVLNPNGVSKPCGLYGDYVCLENVVSNKQGFESQWQQRTGSRLNGKEIEDQARNGSEFAMRLFEQAALTEATLLRGAANIFGLHIDDPSFHVVVHGGLHRTPNLRRRIAQILWQDAQPDKEIRFTEDFDKNACMHGAALYALGCK